MNEHQLDDEDESIGTIDHTNISESSSEDSLTNVGCRAVIFILCALDTIGIIGAVYLTLRYLQNTRTTIFATVLILEGVLIVNNVIGLVSVAVRKKTPQLVLTCIFVTVLLLVTIFTGFHFFALIIELFDFGTRSPSGTFNMFVLFVTGLSLFCYSLQIMLGIWRIRDLTKKE
jgi:hypothetical protein